MRIGICLENPGDVFIETRQGTNLVFYRDLGTGHDVWRHGGAEFEAIDAIRIIINGEKYLKLHGYPEIPEQLRLRYL